VPDGGVIVPNAWRLSCQDTDAHKSTLRLERAVTDRGSIVPNPDGTSRARDEPPSRGIVLREMAMVVGIGLIVGLGLAAIGAQTIRALLYQVEPLDPAVLATVCASILGCALLVSLHPALEAGPLNPMRTLREE